MIDNVKAQLADKDGNLITSGNPLPVSNTPVGSSHKFFTQTLSSTGATNNFIAPVAFGFTSINIIIKNDGSSNISFSFDGTNVDGILQASESISMDNMGQTQIAIKATTTGQTCRVWAW